MVAFKARHRDPNSGHNHRWNLKDGSEMEENFEGDEEEEDEPSDHT
jgi:hypothetical protein